MESVDGVMGLAVLIRLLRQEPVMVPVVYSGPSSVPDVDRGNVDY